MVSRAYLPAASPPLMKASIRTWNTLREGNTPYATCTHTHTHTQVSQPGVQRSTPHLAPDEVESFLRRLRPQARPHYHQREGGCRLTQTPPKAASIIMRSHVTVM